MCIRRNAGGPPFNSDPPASPLLISEWVATVHSQRCHVVYTDYRPTPLQHFIFPAGGAGVYLVVDEKGKFREDNFNKAMATLSTSNLENEVQEIVEGKKKRKKSSEQSDLSKIIKMIMDRNYDPVIVFSFSKRECETNAMQLAKLDFTSDEEKKLIEQVRTGRVEGMGG